MNNWPPFVPYLILAVICAVASVAIVFVTMMTMAQSGRVISDSGMLAIAGMAAAPAIMGIGIASYMPPDQR
jgi:hypothetical protein